MISTTGGMLIECCCRSVVIFETMGGWDAQESRNWDKRILRKISLKTGERKVAVGGVKGSRESGVTGAEQRSASQDRGSEWSRDTAKQQGKVFFSPLFLFKYLVLLFLLPKFHVFLAVTYLAPEFTPWVFVCIVDLVGEGYCILWINFVSECQISTRLNNEGFVPHLYLNLLYLPLMLGWEKLR